MRSKDKRVYLIRTEADLNRLYDEIEKLILDGEVEVEFGFYVPKRTIAQNKLLWAYYEDIGRQIGYTSKDIHLYYRSEFLKPKLKTILDRTMYELPSTTELSTKEFAEYLTNIEVHAAQHGYSLSAPHYRDLALYGEK